MSVLETAWLAPAVHFAWIGQDIVTLDVEADTYGLMVDAAPLIRQGPHRQILTADSDVLAALVEAGLLTADVQDTVPTPPLPPAEIALLPGETTTVALGAGLAAATSALATTARFHHSSLHQLLQSQRSEERLRLKQDMSGLAQVYAAFDAVLPWIPWEGQCLQRAFMLREHLDRCGYAAKWVIGVRTWPFLAHAWVQVGACVVGDSLERTRTFTPILAA